MKKYMKPTIEVLELRVQESLAGPLDWADPAGDVSGGNVTVVNYTLGVGATSVGP